MVSIGSRPCRRRSPSPTALFDRATHRSSSAGSVVGHQIGAAVAAFGAGVIRTQMGSYSLAFLIAGSFAVVAGFAALILPGRRAEAGRLVAAG